MGAPKITLVTKEHYLQLRRQGFPIIRAAKEAGVSRSWANAFERGMRNSSGGAWREARLESKLPDGPLPPDGLSAAAKRALGDFEFFRLRYFGHLSTPWQVEAAELAVQLLASDEKEFLVVNCPPGAGKALALDTPIPTPGGWSTMKDVEVGDQVFDERGRPCRVTFKSEVFYDHDCYEVRADDGSSVVADADHLWMVRLDGYAGGRPDYPGKTGPKPAPFGGRTVHTTRDLAVRRSKRPQLQVAAPLHLPEAALPIPPYALGVWLGDGDSAGARITSLPADAEVIRREIEAEGLTTFDLPQDNRWRIGGPTRTLYRRDSFVSLLRTNDLLNNKHIPDAYFRASSTQRLSLLQGLIDTDGHVSEQGHVEFTSTRRRLAEGVRHLAFSLGVKCSLSEGRATLNGKDCGPKYRVCFMLADAARLPRKRARCRNGQRTPSRYLTVVPVPSRPTQCIQVDSPSHLYLAGEGMLVTHNTTLFTHDIPAWLTVRDRSVRGIIGSKTYRQAEVHCARLRRSFERTTPIAAKDDEKRRGLAVDAEGVLARDFGRFRPTSEEIWQRGQFTVMQKDGAPIDEKESTWTAFGMDSGSLGWRVDYITWDDVIDKKVLRTLESIQTQREWWDDEAETRLEPAGVLVLPGQRLASNDLYRYNLDKLLERDDDDPDEDASGPRKYRHVIFKAHFEERCEGIHKPSEAKPYPDGCLLDPLRVSWRDLRAVMKNPKYRTVYQQEDVDPSNVLVPEAWFDGGIDPEDGTLCPGVWDDDRDICELPAGLVPPLVSVATVDPSPTKMWACEWWVYAPEAFNQSFLMDLERRAMPANEMLDYNINSGEFYGLMEDWQARSVLLGHPITTWIVEINAAQRFLLQYDHVRKWQAKWGVDILPHSTTTRKLDEERGPWMIREHFKYGRVRVPGKQGRASEARYKSMKLRDEVTRFPEASTDDCVMACWFYFANLPSIMPPMSIPLMPVPSWVAAGA